MAEKTAPAKSELSIDDQLAQANRDFDVRLKTETKAEAKEENLRLATRKVVKKGPPPKVLKHKAGEVAHTHYKEDDYSLYEYDCLYVNHTVRDRKGFTINGVRYQGKVVVPQCTANYLGMMENRHRQMERGIFEDRGRSIRAGEIRG